MRRPAHDLAGRLSPVKRRFLAKATARRPFTRQVSALAAGIAVVAVSAGCQVASPVQTDVPYVPADGVPVDVGQLAIRDLLLVGDGSGPAVISGSAINLGEEQMTVKIAPQASQDSTSTPSSSEISLGPREQVNLATKGLEISSLAAKPGTLVPVTITSSTGGTAVASVPVLRAADSYASLTPAPTGS